MMFQTERLMMEKERYYYFIEFIVKQLLRIFMYFGKKVFKVDIL